MAAPLLSPDPQRATCPVPAESAAGDLAAGWALIAEAGEAIAGLAQLGRELVGALTPADFAMRAAAAGPVRLMLAEQMIDDCAAALHTGLNALIAAEADGRDCTAAALTLWREFDRARGALIDLTTPRH